MAIRKTYLIDWKVQGSYMMITSLCVLLTGLSVGIATYALLFSSFTEQMGAASLASLNFKLFVPSDMMRLAIIGLGVLILSVLTGLFFIFYTHRIVGPWKRLQSAIESVERGDYSVRLKVRKNDCMLPVIESFNQMVASLSKNSPKGR